MSDEFQKVHHSKRLFDDQVKIKKQVKIAKQFGWDVTEAHKFHKKHAMNCGDPNCVMCGNPRKFFKEPTIQEKRFYQKERITERGQDGNAADC